MKKNEIRVALASESAGTTGIDDVDGSETDVIDEIDSAEEVAEVADTASVAPADDCPCCCARHKATPRDAQFQADLQRRLNRAIGQLNGVKAMLDDNRYCGDILTQLAAAESAVHRVSEMLLANHMQTCVIEQIRQGNDSVVDEAMELIHRFGGR